jgi:hypothetical protein
MKENPTFYIYSPSVGGGTWSLSHEKILPHTEYKELDWLAGTPAAKILHENHFGYRIVPITGIHKGDVIQKIVVPGDELLPAEIKYPYRKAQIFDAREPVTSIYGGFPSRDADAYRPPVTIAQRPNVIEAKELRLIPLSCLACGAPKVDIERLPIIQCQHCDTIYYLLQPQSVR